ncbi:MAG TPA: hypothetical protein PK677_05220 [Acidiphilium sp.]|nr:MAG: hypothetical protein B7Z67_05145 [Acidiphilium sp. 21-60-14]OYV92509.1 MAG: hypothetical protein B7Z57_00305 [Acidiphilium sp. 37-60-79]OZB40962.1 MAG: hypothetical protein B7X48_02630 [Acidiphilium sp. 34-60-192]HQT87938.1 hypothetical protein [Acidiphilium sp.]HQU22710.1 hypothetical protein [Acidiphilium sp.]
MRDYSDTQPWARAFWLRRGPGASGILLLPPLSLPLMRRDHRWQAIIVTLIIALFSVNPPAPPIILNKAKRTGSRGVC